MFLREFIECVLHTINEQTNYCGTILRCHDEIPLKLVNKKYIYKTACGLW